MLKEKYRSSLHDLKNLEPFVEKSMGHLIQVGIGTGLILTVTFQSCSGTILATLPCLPDEDLQILEKAVKKIHLHSPELQKRNLSLVWTNQKLLFSWPSCIWEAFRGEDLTTFWQKSFDLISGFVLFVVIGVSVGFINVLWPSGNWHCVTMSRLLNFYCLQDEDDFIQVDYWGWSLASTS